MFDEMVYYEKHYQCKNADGHWVDQYGNQNPDTCDCGEKTIPQFDVTHAVISSQCRVCYKIHGNETNGKSRSENHEPK